MLSEATLFAAETDIQNGKGRVHYVGAEVYIVKWRNWKMIFKEFEIGY